MIGASVKDANAASGHHKIELVVVYIVSYVGRLDEQRLALLVERGASGVARAVMADAGEGDIEARAAGTSRVCARSGRKGVRDQWIVGIRRRRMVMRMNPVPPASHALTLWLWSVSSGNVLR